MAELLAAKDILYHCHDRLSDHREALFTRLKAFGYSPASAPTGCVLQAD